MSSGRRWTQSDDAYLRAEYVRLRPENVAIALDRSLTSVRKRAVIIGVAKSSKRTCAHTPEAEVAIRKLNADGLNDTEIAKRLNMDRHAVSYRRRQLGLPNHGDPRSAKMRKKISDGVHRQCRRLGLERPCDLRRAAWQQKARELGWPTDLRPRHLQILELLWNGGPMTRPEIVAGIGMEWRGSRGSLKSNDPEGSYLAHLAKRGLVVRLPRARKVTGRGKGRSLSVYSIPMHVQPTRVEASHDR